MLVESLRGLGRTIVEILGNRLESLALDVKEDRIRLVSLLMLGAFTFFLISLGVVLAVFWIILASWEGNRLLVLGILTGLFVISGAVLLFLLVTRLRNLPGAFDGTIAEFDKDREALGGRIDRKEP
jgi:uncharacterized membrane protein YqjE